MKKIIEIDNQNYEVDTEKMSVRKVYTPITSFKVGDVFQWGTEGTMDPDNRVVILFNSKARSNYIFGGNYGSPLIPYGHDPMTSNQVLDFLNQISDRNYYRLIGNINKF